MHIVSTFFHLQSILLQHSKYELIKFLQGNLFCSVSQHQYIERITDYGGSFHWYQTKILETSISPLKNKIRKTCLYNLYSRALSSSWNRQ